MSVSFISVTRKSPLIFRFKLCFEITISFLKLNTENASITQNRYPTIFLTENLKNTETAITEEIKTMVTVSILSDFKAKGNAQRYLQLVKLRSQQTALQQAIERVREYYSGATADEKREMAPEIIATEQQQHQIHIEIHNLEKIIRNEENITLRNTQK